MINKKVTENKTNYSKLISWDNAKNFIRSLINRNREKLIYNESLNIDEICTIKTIKIFLSYLFKILIQILFYFYLKSI